MKKLMDECNKVLWRLESLQVNITYKKEHRYNKIPGILKDAHNDLSFEHAKQYINYLKFNGRGGYAVLNLELSKFTDKLSQIDNFLDNLEDKKLKSSINKTLVPFRKIHSLMADSIHYHELDV